MTPPRAARARARSSTPRRAETERHAALRSREESVERSEGTTEGGKQPRSESERGCAGGVGWPMRAQRTCRCAASEVKSLVLTAAALFKNPLCETV